MFLSSHPIRERSNIIACNGSACGGISTGGVGDRMQFTNQSAKNVKITIGIYPNGSVDFTLGPGQSRNEGGAIMQAFSAEYV